MTRRTTTNSPVQQITTGLAWQMQTSCRVRSSVRSSHVLTAYIREEEEHECVPPAATNISSSVARPIPSTNKHRTGALLLQTLSTNHHEEAAVKVDIPAQETQTRADAQAYTCAVCLCLSSTNRRDFVDRAAWRRTARETHLHVDFARMWHSLPSEVLKAHSQVCDSLLTNCRCPARVCLRVTHENACIRALAPAVLQ